VQGTEEAMNSDKPRTGDPQRTGPSVNRGRSKQDYGTPWGFIRSVEAKWGPLIADLAASGQNKKAAAYYSIENDALSRSWSQDFPEGNLWLNPPFANISPWAEKCKEEGVRRDGLIFLLVPASIGTDWFAQHVHRHARVLGLSPRLIFEGTKDPYPKDLMLCLFGKATDGFDVWRWS
jgi:phage N-6-adenine-methyltransferase